MNFSSLRFIRISLLLLVQLRMICCLLAIVLLISTDDRHISLSNVGPDAGRLERGALQWHGENKCLGSSLLHCVDDLRQLRSIQLARRHSRRRIFDGGNEHCFGRVRLAILVSVRFRCFLERQRCVREWK